MKKLLACFMSMVILASLVGCTNPAVIASDKEYDTSPEVSQTDLEAVADGNNTFAVDLYQALKEDSEGNLFYSPYSISSALAMTYAGARGETEKQMADTLHFTLSQERLHQAFNSVSLALAGRGERASGQEEYAFILNNINAIWGQKNFKFKSAFLDTLAENYGAGMRICDFLREPEESRLTINDWVSEQTANKIQELLPEGSIDSSVFLVLTNAIYFKATWWHMFGEEMTAEEQFNLLSGDTVTVPMMHQTDHFDCVEGDGYQAVELLYRNRELSMVVLLPEQGNFENFENNLDYTQLDEIINNLEYRKVILSMPKFDFASEFELKQTLSDMGMPDAFGGADFSGICDCDAFIGNVYHDAFISVDEEGTEAGAATAVTILKGTMLDPVEFTMDRPFIFLIRDIETNTILFMGRVMNPLE